jgi:hypothetical protein
MSTVKHLGPTFRVVAPGETIADARARIALVQSALYTTRLALARSVGAGAGWPAPLDPANGASAQARWYAEAQRNFQAWLAQGGFSQPAHGEHDLAQAAAAPRRPQALSLPDGSARPADAYID